MKRHQIKIGFIVFTILFFCKVQAQEVSTLQFMRMSPYRSYSNPAKFSPYQGYAGVPVLGNVNVNLQNSSLHFDDVFRYGADGTAEAVMIDQLVNNLNADKNWLNLHVNVEVLGFGIRDKKNFFSVSYRLRAQQYLHYNETLLKLPLQGNSSYIGADNPANIDLKINGQAYQELGFGFQRQISKKLSVGGRAKLLFGVYNITTNDLNAQIYTDSDINNIRLNYQLNAQIASVIPIKIEDNKMHLETSNISVTPFFQNMGFGIDLGAEYLITDKIGVAAAVTDLGFISWKTSPVEVTGTISDQGQFYDNGSFLFQGFSAGDLQNFINDTGFRRLFLDTLKQYFPINSSVGSSYSSMLNANFCVEGFYDLGESHRFSAMFQGTFANKSFYPAFTIAYDGNFFKMLDVCVHYTMMKQSYANVGLGLGIHLGPVNLYAATNNIFGAFNPFNANNAQVQMGIVIHWGKTSVSDVFDTEQDSQKPEKRSKESKKTQNETEGQE